MIATFERLSAILVKDYSVPSAAITLDAPLESLGVDSLATVELLWSVEDAFGIKLPAEPASLSTIGDVVRFIDDVIAIERGGAEPGSGALPTAIRPAEPALRAT